MKVYIKRLHQALECTLREARLELDAHRVLITQRTVGNEVGYQLKGKCEWVHIDLESRKSAQLGAHHSTARKSVTDFVARQLAIEGRG